MFELSSLDVHFLVNELQQFVGAKIEKIVQSAENKKDLLFTLYLKDHPKLHMRFYLPGVICLPKEKPQVYPQVPPGYAMFLRKYLKNARLTAVAQRGFDRIILLTFEKKETYTLVIELLQPGNMLLLVNDVIKQPLENQTFKDRKLLGKQPYVAPPPAFDIFTATDEEIATRITTSEKENIVKTLALDLGLGGIYAEELCARADIEKHATTVPTEKIITALTTMKEEQLAPYTDAKRAYPFKLVSKEGEPHDGSFVQALATYIDDAPVAIVQKKKKKEKKLADIQAKRIRELEQQAADARQKADAIYEHYQRVQEILTAIVTARKNKQDVADALKSFKEVQRFIPKTGEVELQLS